MASEKCKVCNGTGSVILLDNSIKICPTCEGSGRIQLQSLPQPPPPATGGQAFPMTRTELVDPYTGQSRTINERGMTLRDYFAGQIIMGMLANPITETCDDSTVENCFRVADAMIAEREREK